MPAENGTLLYLVGPSGSGKDTLLTAARQRMDGKAPIVFAHRYLTRPAEAGGENHVELRSAEFAQRHQHGLFAMAWEAHGNRYGIGIEIDHWLRAGLHVVVNGSGKYLPEALRRYPDLRVIQLWVSPEVLFQRLTQRGREDEEAIRARIARSQNLQLPQRTYAATFTNHAPLPEASSQFTQVLLDCIPTPENCHHSPSQTG